MGGVLFNWKKGLVSLAKHCNVSHKKILQVFEKYDDDFCRGKASKTEYWKFYKKELHTNIEIKNYIKWWTDQFIIIPESHELLTQLSKKYKIGILTNIYKGAFEENVRKNQIPKIKYSAIIKSCDLSQIKPDKDFFLYAQKETRLNSNEIFFIDDKKINILAAKKLGWEAELFNESNIKESVDRIKSKLST